MKAEVQRRVNAREVKDRERLKEKRNRGLASRKERRKTQRTVKTEWERKPQSRRQGGNRKRNEVVIRVEGSPHREGTSRRTKERKGRRRKSREERKRERQEKLVNNVEVIGKDKTNGKDGEWKQQVARVGTGFRVRRDEKNPRRRRFDVGYSDRKAYKRKEGVEVQIEQSSTGRTVRAKGPDARVKVMNTVSMMEKRRPVSPYTGSGIRRKERVGKLKLKPTKPQGKA